jgi:hypothetical protein
MEAHGLTVAAEYRGIPSSHRPSWTYAAPFPPLRQPGDLPNQLQFKESMSELQLEEDRQTCDLSLKSSVTT